jgi:hypothetical protein
MGGLTKSEVKFAKSDGIISDRPLEILPVNFYMTDPISRASVTMAKCSA